jgi:hypothetical protein
MNTNPYQARIARAGKRRTALSGVLGTVSKALQTAESLLQDEDTAVRLRAVHAISQAAATYARLYEVGELESRLEALEQEQNTGE